MQNPRILSGPGSLTRLKEQLDGPVALVSDQGLDRIGLVEDLAQLLGAEKTFCSLEGEPTAPEIDQTASGLRGWSGTLVGLGGGSALDLTKLAGSVAQGDQPADAYAACAIPLPQGLPLVLIPTTAGTGSEMTRTAVFSDSQGNKTWAWGDELQARMAVLDPELTLGLPLSSTIITAIDALSHALEAATAVNSTSLTTNLAQQAVSMIPQALAEAQEDPENLAAREALLNASGLAGIALNSCGTGLAHALAHALASVIKIPHGLAIAWSLKVTLNWNQTETYEGFPWLASDPYGTYSAWLEQLSVPSLPDFPIKELEAALLRPENRPMLENNARPVPPENLLELCRELHACTH